MGVGLTLWGVHTMGEELTPWGWGSHHGGGNYIPSSAGLSVVAGGAVGVSVGGAVGVVAGGAVGVVAGGAVGVVAGGAVGVAVGGAGGGTSSTWAQTAGTDPAALGGGWSSSTAEPPAAKTRGERERELKTSKRCFLVSFPSHVLAVIPVLSTK